MPAASLSFLELNKRGVGTLRARRLSGTFDPEANAQLLLLRGKSEAAAAPSCRMEVPLAVVLRMRAILTAVAGRGYLATRATPAERAA